MKKMNDKGFSLVELIVVVLIIAIIAVALAPQVMKWVGTAGENVDIANCGEIKSCTQAALAEYLASNETIGSSDKVYYVKADGLYAAAADTNAIDLDTDALAKLIDETMINDYPEIHDSDKVFKITITTDNVVSVVQESV